jgi:hypothetical protein
VQELDAQTLFNGLVTLASFAGGWILNRIYKAIDDLGSDVDKLDTDVRAIPVKYVAKEDYKDDIRDIKDMLRGLYDRVDGKEDRQNHRSS